MSKHYERNQELIPLALLLKQACGREGYSQLDLARKLEVSPQSVSRWCAAVSRPRDYYLAQLCRVLNLPVEEVQKVLPDFQPKLSGLYEPGAHGQRGGNKGLVTLKLEDKVRDNSRTFTARPDMLPMEPALVDHGDFLATSAMIAAAEKRLRAQRVVCAESIADFVTDLLFEQGLSLDMMTEGTAQVTGLVEPTTVFIEPDPTRLGGQSSLRRETGYLLTIVYEDKEGRRNLIPHVIVIKSGDEDLRSLGIFLRRNLKHGCVLPEHVPDEIRQHLDTEHKLT